MVRHCARGRPPLPSPSPTLRTAARDTEPQRRGLFSGAARTLPGSGRRANDILYIRVRRREGENVLHRAAGNDVDNFSVDNALWITAAAGGRSLRGRRRRVCGGSVNAGAEVQTSLRQGRTSFGGMPKSSWAPPKGMRESVNDEAEVQTTARQGRTSFGGMPKSSWAPPKAMRGKCERRGGNINADAANAEVFAGGGCSQGASFVPMAAISRRWRGGRNIIIRVRASGCGESALNPPTSPPIPRRRSAPAPAERHALPAHLHSPTQRRCTPADLTTHSPPKACSRPRTTTRPPRALSHSLPAPTHTRRLRDARPPTPQHIPRRRSAPTPAQRRTLPEHFRSPTQRRCTPAGCAIHSPLPSPPIPRSATLPPLPFRFGHKKTAPHSACAMPKVSVDRRCGRSFGLVSRALFAAVAGRWRVGVGLRPQPWALRSRRCGRVLRA